MPKGRSAARSAGGFAGYKAPSVPPSEGDLVDGESFVISGSGFGTKSTAAPELFDRCYYPSLSDGDALPTFPDDPEFPWTNHGYYGGQILYETSETQRHAGSAGMYKHSGIEGICAERDTATGSYLYVSWWFKTLNSTTPAGSSSKMLRVSNKTNVTGETFSWVPDHSYTSPSADGAGYYPTPPSVGSWHFMEAIFKNGPGGWYTLKIDNDAVADQRPHNLTFDHVWKVGWDGGGDTPGNITFYMDDIYVDSTACRVMLGDASTYSACSSFEMQPVTSWSNTSITITANKGAQSGTAYLYVIDSSNTLVNSNGYSVTVS